MGLKSYFWAKLPDMFYLNLQNVPNVLVRSLHITSAFCTHFIFCLFLTDCLEFSHDCFLHFIKLHLGTSKLWRSLTHLLGKMSVLSGSTFNCKLTKPYLTLPYLTKVTIPCPNPSEGSLDLDLSWGPHYPRHLLPEH